MAFTLRPYQQNAIRAVLEARRDGVRRMVVSLPTGAGKTVIFARLASLARQRVLVLAHREELVQQARARIQDALDDGRTVGIERANETSSPADHVVVASIRSLSDERIDRIVEERAPTLIVYDECHHATADDNKRVLARFGAFDDDWDGTLLGVTATTVRADGTGLDEVFESIVFTLTIAELIDLGFLVPLRGFRVSTAADITRVGCAAGGGDFLVDPLAEAVDVETRNALVARSIQELARGRRTIAFCVNVAHAKHLARACRAIGLRAGTVYGELKRDERSEILAQFRAGELDVVTNVAVLTEGFDDPGVGCVAMARPTRSAGLYTQCVGRGTRLADGKHDCLVLDFVDLGDLSLVTLPTLAGAPNHMDMAGMTLSELDEEMRGLQQHFPFFELESEPGTITLAEITRRAAAFDPLTADVSPEVRAVSPHAWCSLGRAGVVLHIRRRGRHVRFAVVHRTERGKQRFVVERDGHRVAAFERVELAVEAVDYEVHRLGSDAARSALPDASWRVGAAPDVLLERLRERGCPVVPETVGEALHLLAWLRWTPTGSRRRGKQRATD